MKKLIIILTALLISNFTIAQTKDSCKTFVKFINKTKLKLEVTIYDKMPGQFTGATVINILTIAPGKEKKMKAEDGETYFYGAQEPHKGLVPIGGTSPQTWKGSVDAEECKTIEEIIE